MALTDGHEPVRLEIDPPETLDNWRAIGQWVLAIPHLLIAEVLGNLAGVVWIISLFAILFTGTIPDGLYNLQVMTLRYRVRAYAYAGFLHTQYPPFTFPMTAADPGDTPVRLSVERPATFHRWLPLVKWFLAIPHYVVMVAVGIAVFVVYVVAFFAVLFTGRWPLAIRTFVIGYAKYTVRVTAYVLLLRDEYPSFRIG